MPQYNAKAAHADPARLAGVRVGRLVVAGIVATAALGGGARSTAQGAERIQGVVSRVADGDTLDVTSGRAVYTIRLEGADAPELDQRFGRQARLHLKDLAMSQPVTADVVDHDRYGRIVARVELGARDLSEEMIRSGFAWHYARYNADERLASLEREARHQRRGLWADSSPIAPWIHRVSAARSPPSPVEPARTRPSTLPAGPLHGNVSSHVYHAPGCRDYTCRRCTEVFMTREAAEAAGYHAHEACARR